MLTRAKLDDFKRVLSEALRTTTADDSLESRFVELRPGSVAALLANVNHLVTGRRGVGKSTTLAVLQRKAEQNGARVIFVDVETHKERAYPDVLIEIVSDILEALRPARSLKKADWKLRKTVTDLLSVLDALAQAAPEVTTTDVHEHEKAASRSITLSGRVQRRFVALSGRASSSRSQRTNRSSTSSQTRRKEDFLRDLAPAIATALETAASANGRKGLLLVLDDFYFVGREDQPLVLDHLHGVTKRSNVWLKIGSVHSRTRSFADGDPPLGMQPPHDLQHLPLDVGLADFGTAKTFLEEVTDGVLAPVSMSVRDVMTETARERAVLIAGGAVARDYFDLLIAAADAAWEQAQKKEKGGGEFNINAENVQTGAGLRLDRKQTDLRNDAGRDAQKLETQFADLISFARDRNTYFVLIQRKDLDSDWGRDIVQLEDLRFVHRIMTTRPNTGKWHGVDTVVFMLDIPALVSTRMQKAPIEFWKPGKRDELRKGSWVYTREWTETARKTTASGREPAAEGASSVVVDPAESVLRELPFEQ